MGLWGKIFGKKKSKSKPSPIDTARADLLNKYTDFYTPHLQTPDQLQETFGPSLLDVLNKGNSQPTTPGVFGAGHLIRPGSATGSSTAGRMGASQRDTLGSPTQMQGGLPGGSNLPTRNPYNPSDQNPILDSPNLITGAQQQQQQNQGNAFASKAPGSTTPSAPNPIASGPAGGSPTQTQAKGPVGAPQAQGPQSNVLVDAFNRANTPVTAYGGTEFQDTAQRPEAYTPVTPGARPEFQTNAQRPDAPGLENFFDDYSGPKNFYEGYEDPTTFFNQEGKTGRGTFDKVLGRLTAGDSYDTDFGKFFDDYGGEGKPQGLGGYARRAEDVFGERINRRASERFGREGSGLGASGLLNSSALSNLERGISDDRDQTQAEYGVGVLGNALNTYGQHEGARANRQLGADQGVLNLGYGDFARDIASRQSDFDTGLNRQVGAHQNDQGNRLSRYGQESQQYLGERGQDTGRYQSDVSGYYGDLANERSANLQRYQTDSQQYLGEKESDLGRYRTDLDSGRQSHEFAQGANQEQSNKMFKLLAEAEERERLRKLGIAQTPNRAIEAGLGTTPGTPLGSSSSTPGIAGPLAGAIRGLIG